MYGVCHIFGAVAKPSHVSAPRLSRQWDTSYFGIIGLQQPGRQSWRHGSSYLYFSTFIRSRSLELQPTATNGTPVPEYSLIEDRDVPRLLKGMDPAFLGMRHALSISQRLQFPRKLKQPPPTHLANVTQILTFSHRNNQHGECGEVRETQPGTDLDQPASAISAWPWPWQPRGFLYVFRAMRMAYAAPGK